jgi:hypothetical protein
VNVRAAVAISAFLIALGAAPGLAQETATLMPPPGWVRQDVDTAHAKLASHARTIAKWTPAKVLINDTSALYFSIGDSGSDILEVYVRALTAALPANAKTVSNTDTTVCKGQTGWFLAYDVPATASVSGLSVEETVSVDGVVAAIARYERPLGSPEDPLAREALDTLCPQSEFE